MRSQDSYIKSYKLANYFTKRFNLPQNVVRLHLQPYYENRLLKFLFILHCYNRIIAVTFRNRWHSDGLYSNTKATKRWNIRLPPGLSWPGTLIFTTRDLHVCVAVDRNLFVAATNLSLYPGIRGGFDFNTVQNELYVRKPWNWLLLKEVLILGDCKQGYNVCLRSIHFK